MTASVILLQQAMHIFRISFFNQGRVYQLHAERISQGDLYGFLEVSGLLFDEHTSLVIDPAEEKLKAEFSGVSRILVPLHAVIRIDEVEKRGKNRILELEGNDNVTPFPFYRPERPGS